MCPGLQTLARHAHEFCFAGLWVENLGDVFVTLAFPTAEAPGPTYAIIFLIRIVENLAYLWFQLNIWFKFRVWIKGKFKKDQVRLPCLAVLCTLCLASACWPAALWSSLAPAQLASSHTHELMCAHR